MADMVQGPCRSAMADIIARTVGLRPRSGDALVAQEYPTDLDGSPLDWEDTSNVASWLLKVQLVIYR